MTESAAELLAREAASLVARLRVWTPTRWQAQTGDRTRAQVVHHLASSLVRAAGETDQPLPFLDNPLVLPDQLAVVADDLVRTRPDDAVALAAVAHLLAHRRELLGEDAPASLRARLGDLPISCPG